MIFMRSRNAQQLDSRSTLKLDFAKFGVSSLFLSKVIEEKPLEEGGGGSLGKGKVNLDQHMHRNNYIRLLITL